MWIRHSDLVNGQLVRLEKEGPPVALLEQTQDHRVIFGDRGDDEPASMPASDFFQTHREAGADDEPAPKHVRRAAG